MNDARQKIVAFSKEVKRKFISMVKSPEALSIAAAMVLFYFICSISENRALTQGPQIPKKIFSASSPVEDFNTGDLQAAMTHISEEKAEYWFVMYYAHWDATSLEVVPEMEKAAFALKEKICDGNHDYTKCQKHTRRLTICGTHVPFDLQVTFVAVNCWWPFGSCKFKVNPRMFPAFAGYVVGREGVQYTGIKKACEMVVFMQRMMNPFVYIQSREDILQLRAKEDTIAVAYFNFNNTLTPRGLPSFHQAAMFASEKDAIEPVPFAVITNKLLANSIGLRETKSIILLRNFNFSVVYPKDRLFKASEIVSWVYGDLREQVVQWISPAGVKSMIMAKQLLKGPSLVLFTPHNHKKGFDNDFYTLREIALQYYNCNGSSIFLSKLVSILQEKRSSKCNNHVDSTTIGISRSERPCCQTLANLKYSRHFIPTGNVCQICEENFYEPLHQLRDKVPCDLSPHACCNLWSRLGESIFAIPDSCNHIRNYYNPFRKCELCCTSRHLSHRTGVNNQVPQVPLQSSLHRTHEYSYREQCSEGNYDSLNLDSNEYSTNKFSSCDEGADNCAKVLPEFTGLGCKMNKTIHFYGIRSEYFQNFAKRLGIPSSALKGSSRVAVIIDIQEEEHSIINLSSSLSLHQALQEAILNYSQGSVRRQLLSAKKPASKTSQSDTCSDMQQAGCITEVTSKTFHEIVLESKKDVLLLYYIPACGACKRLFHSYLGVARTFYLHHDVTVARINCAENDLPWEFAPMGFPSLIFFPLGQKENSVPFPQDQPFTYFSIVKFIIEQSSDRH